jgi:putative ABC transport system permease protein
MPWWRRRSQKDFNSEVEAHIALEADRLRAEGLSEGEALRRAGKSFGNVLQSQERFYESHRALWFDHLKQDSAYAIRQLAKSKSFTTIAVLTLALGIGSTSVIFTLVDATMLRPLPYHAGDRIVHITDVRALGRSTGGLVGVPRFFDLEGRSRSVDSLSFYYFDHPTMIAGSSLPVPVAAVGVNESFWRTIGIEPMLGRTFRKSDDLPNSQIVVVISHAFWQREFGGDSRVLNRQVTLDGKAATIIGVLPPELEYPSRTEIWTPARFDPAQWTYRGEGTRFINVIGRLKPHVSVEQMQQELKLIGERLRKDYPSTDSNWRFSMEPLREFLYGGVRRPLLVLLAAAGLLLMIACINVANLLLSRGTTRAHEVSVRRALGASQGRILAQFLAENVVLALIGGGIGLVSTYACLRWFGTHLPGRLGASGISVNWLVMWFTAGLSMLTGVVFGCVPAVQSRRLDLNTTLKQGDFRVGRTAGGQLRTAFICAQVAVSVVLLVGASLLAQSLWNLLKSPLGFQPEHVLTFATKLPWNGKPAVVQRFYDDLLSRIQRLRGVSTVGHVSALPTVDWHLRRSFDVDWEARTLHSDAVNVEERFVGGDYFKAMGITLLAGRYLTEDDRKAKLPRGMVNEQFVREYFPSSNIVVSHHLINGTMQLEIVGVVGNVRGTAGSIATAPGPELYLPSDDGETGRYFVVRSTVPADQLARAIREQVHEIDPTQAVQNIATFDQLLDQSVAQPRFNMGLLSAFAIAAALLACVGIYGVVSYSAAQRSVEVGIRMAFGANRREISYLFIRRALVAALIGVSIGGVAALSLSRFLQTQLYGVAPNNWLTLVGSALLLLIATLLASLVPALRAASLSPLAALRQE